MPRWVCLAPAALAWIGLSGLTGCHAVPQSVSSADLKSGHGRVERPVPAAIGPSIQATLAALDDQGVRPKQFMIHSLTEGTDQPSVIGIEPEATNRGMVPTGTRFDDIFVRHQLSTPDGHRTPFVPRFVTYKGDAKDGRAVVVTIASRRGDEASNLVTVRVGHGGDEAWSQAFLDKVGTHLAPEGQAPSLPPNPTLPR